MGKRGPAGNLPADSTLIKLAKDTSLAEIGRRYGVSRQRVKARLDQIGWNTKPDSDNLLTVTQACEHLGRPKYTVYRWARRGWLEKIQPAGRYGKIYFQANDVDRIKRRLDAGLGPVTKMERKKIQGVDYTYAYIPLSADEVSELSDILTPAERAEAWKRAARQKRKQETT